MIHSLQKQFLRCILFSVFYTLLPQTQTAQSIWQLGKEDVWIGGLVKPLEILPDSIKTYQVVPQIELDAQTSGITNDLINAAFSLAFYKKKTMDADLTLYVTVHKTIEKSELKSRRTWLDGGRLSVYWYEERFEPQITVELKNRAGEMLYSETGGLTWVYKTEEKKTDVEAKMAFMNRVEEAELASGVKLNLGKRQINLPTGKNAYLQQVLGIHRETLNAWANNLKSTFDYGSEIISLYYPKKGETTAFLKNVESVKQALRLIPQKEAHPEIIETLKPYLSFFEKELASTKPKSKADKQRYHASALNVINIYRCLEDFDKAQFYIRLMIKENYEIPHAAHIADMKERFEAHNYYKKTGMSLYQANQQTFWKRFDALKKQTSSEGYIILRKDNTKQKGTILNVVQNFQDNKVSLKYEKTLNDPVAHKEIPLIDVKEIHFEDWHLAVVPYTDIHKNRIYLTEIVYQTSKITLSKMLPEIKSINSEKLTKIFTKDSTTQQMGGVEFLQKYSEADFTDINDKINKAINDKRTTTFDENLSHYLSDCPTISQQAKHGYYTNSTLLQALMDYDSLCTQNPKTTTVNTHKSTENQHHTSKNISYNLGLSTGMNNFTSLLGLSSNIRLQDKWFGRMGVGTGRWGTKFAAGVKYDLQSDMRYRSGWSFAAGYSHSLGSKKNLTFQGGTVVSEFQVHALAVDALNVSTIYNKFLGKKKSIFLEVGYAIALQKQPWVIQTKKVEPTDDVVSTIKFSQPGGIILGLGINFGVK